MIAAPNDPSSGLSRSLHPEINAVQKPCGDAGRLTPATLARAVDGPRRGGAIRDTFSFPRDDHRLFEELQQRCYAAGFSASKSELVRAGLHALADMPAPAFATVLAALEKLKPGPAPKAPPESS